MSHAQRAVELFEKGYNCAQAVFTAFCDVMGLEEEAALRLSSSFGGGMGRMREVCGAVSGAFMVLGMLYGYSDLDPESKKAHYALIRGAAEKFKEQNGSIICRELLSGAGVDSSAGGEPEKRTEAYYKKRPCRELVEIAAQIVDDIIESR
ncbi:MAG: C_GCAxxG_C_C family protein [Clostridia bacterium]|nr:C_GCAxxG_C_C family protein [Clostridia bacterium]